MTSKQRRRRKYLETDLKFTTIIIIALLILLIPVLFCWLGMKRAERIVPDYATGHIVEVTSAADGQ